MSSKKQRSKEMTTKTNNETPEALSHIKRAHGIYFTSKVLLGWIIKLYFNFRSKVYRPKNKSFILISIIRQCSTRFLKHSRLNRICAL